MFGFEKVSSLTKFNFLLKVVRHQLVPFEKKKMKQSQSTCALCTGTLAFLFDLFFFGGVRKIT